jgi:ABC-type uncharacterized transport system ATPase subunit
LHPGTIHALLGENGAGKSTLVKGLVGYGVLDEGQRRWPTDAKCEHRQSPRDAQALGIGMVYQHFTLATGHDGGREPVARAWAACRWRSTGRAERAELEEFMRRMPFGCRWTRRPAGLAAGEKQKLEILKQLYLKPALPDPRRADLGADAAGSRRGARPDARVSRRRGELTVLMITHKFREVMAYADDVTVLRKGRQVGTRPSRKPIEINLRAG